MTIRSRVYEEHQRKLEEEQGVERRSKIGTGDRAEKIRTYNYPQNRVTDHRIGYNAVSYTHLDVYKRQMKSFYQAWYPNMDEEIYQHYIRLFHLNLSLIHILPIWIVRSLIIWQNV